MGDEEVEEAYIREGESGEVIEQDEDEMDVNSDDEEIILENDSVMAFDAHEDSVYSIALHPTISIIATGGGDNLAFIWNGGDGKQMAKLTGHDDSIIDCTFSLHDRGKYILTAGMDGKIRVWKVGKQWEFVTSAQEVEELVWIKANPASGVLAAGANDGSVWIHTIPDLTVVNCFFAHTTASTSGAFSSDGKSLLSTSGDGSAACFDVDSGTQLFKVTPSDARLGGADGWTAGIIHADRSVCIIGSATGDVRVLSLQGDILASWQFDEGVETIDYNNDVVALGGLEGKIGIFTIGSWQLRKTVHHDDAVVKVAFVENTNALTSCSMDKTVRRWDVRTGQQLHIWKGHAEGILGFVQTRDGSTIFTAGDDGLSLVFTASS